MPASGNDAAGAPVTAGFAVATDGRFAGSADLLSLLGFTSGEVVPTRAALAAHIPPDDRHRWQQALDSVLTTGGTAFVWHRLTTADNRERRAATTLTATAEHGRIVGVVGVLADLTETFRAAAAAQVSDAVDRAVASRGPIEQAKGVLMAVLDLDDAQAFDLLRWHSSHANVKLRELCALVVDRMSGAEGALPPRQRLAAVLAQLGPAATPNEGTPKLPADRGWISTAAPARGPADDLATGQLPAALLPRILTRAVEDASVSITVADMLAPDQPLVYVNAAFEQLTGYHGAEILGKNCRFLQAGDRDEEQTAELREAIGEGRSVDAVMRNHRADGSLFYNEIHLSPVRNRNGRLTHYIGYQLDATERVERERQLERLAFHDPATELLNRVGAIRAIDALMFADQHDDRSSDPSTDSSGGPAGLELVAIRSAQFDDEDSRGGAARSLTVAAARRLLELAGRAQAARVAPDCFVLFGAPGSLAPDDELIAGLDRPAADAAGAGRLVGGHGRVGLGRVGLGRVRAPQDGLTAQNLIGRAEHRAGEDARTH